MKDHEVIVNEFGFVPAEEYVEVEMESDSIKDVPFFNGSVMRFRTMRADHDPTDRASAQRLLHETYEKGEMLTGIFFVDTGLPTLTDTLELTGTPLCQLSEMELRPDAGVLKTLMGRYA